MKIEFVKETKPDSNNPNTKDSYIQNEEQKNGSIWNTIKNSK